MNQRAIRESAENQWSALNAKAEALSMRDASAWEEAIDWGASDYSALCPPEWRLTAASDCD